MSLDQQPPHPSVSERRGQRLAPLQTNFSRPTARASAQVRAPIPTLALSSALRSQRPRPSDYQNESEGERIPLQQPPVKRQTSKPGLRGLFGREKTSRKFNNDTRLAEIDEVETTVAQTVIASDAPLSPNICATPKTVASPTMVTSPSGDSNRTRVSSKSRVKTGEDRPVASEHGWKPPPLFQAYPQGIKHDCLWAPKMSADSILRIHATTKNNSSRDEDPQGNQPQTDESSAERKKKEEKEKKHMRSVSETIGKTEWAQKIYVLVTSGYILQYSGSGKHDRLPEKMLQVGPRSVAFASDAIPGKHWVLQVSQSSGEDGTATVDTRRPLFSRLGFQRSHARRWARSFLLVFSNPDDMSSWLLAVRAQIEARGGKKYVSEKLYDDDMEHELRPRQSIRQMVQKDPNRISSIYLQPQPSAGPDDKDPALSDQSRRSSYISQHRHSIVFQSGVESRSDSISTAQTDVTPPVNNNNGVGRFYSSASNSVATSAPQSPTLSSPQKRQSSLHAPVPSAEMYDPPRSQSTVPEPILRSTSPPAPNFSVPSFSKRFASKAAQAQFPYLHRVDSNQSNVVQRDDSDDQLDALSAFPSPPQSPRNMSRAGMNDVHEHHSTIRDAFQKRQVRVSNSDDSLADPQPRRSPPMTRIPSINTTISSTTPHSSRPSSIAVDPLTKPPPADPEPPRTAPDKADQTRREPQRGRVSSFCPIDLAGRPINMARRKSMPGLSGPPAAPPPNCPLPKLPLPVNPSPENGVPPISPPPIRSCKSPTPKTMRERQKSVPNSHPPVSFTPLPSATPSIDR